MNFQCQKFKIATEFLQEHEWPTLLSDSRFNRCYCNTCYPSEAPDTFDVGGQTYLVPRGYTRIGVRIEEAYAKHLNIWEKWLNCYHGTSIKSAKSIIEHRQLLLPGEETMDGKKISIREGHIPKEIFFFTTPSIHYASHNAYASSYEFKSPSDEEYYNIKVVLQCKQKPDSFVVQPETVGQGKKRICPVFGNHEMEWKSKSRSAIIPYGMLLLVEHADSRLDAMTRRGTNWGAQEFAASMDCETECEMEWEQVECPHCYQLKDWINPKYNQGAILKCESRCCKAEFKAFNCPHCENLFIICACFNRYESETFFPCNNEKCGKELMSRKCPHCPKGYSYCKTPNDFQAAPVQCAARKCRKSFQVVKCPHCEEVENCKSVVGNEGVTVTCSYTDCMQKYQLVMCTNCSNVNVCPNVYIKACGSDDIVTCAYKGCDNKFKQPLQPRPK